MEKYIYIFGQCLGALAVVMGFISYQMKTRQQLLLLQALTSLTFCVHYLMIGAVSGMAMNVVCLIRNFVYFGLSSKEKTPKWIPVAFAVVTAIIGLFSWNAWYCVFIFLGLVIHSVCIAMKNPQNVRKSILVTSPLVLIYNAFVSSYGGMIYESIAVISSIIGIIRYKDKKADQ
jgi:hypothetical protein